MFRFASQHARRGMRSLHQQHEQQTPPKIDSNFLLQCGGVTAVVFCITPYAYSFRQCSGPSMKPTLQENGVVLVDHFSAKVLSKPFKVGDVVVSTKKNNRWTCK